MKKIVALVLSLVMVLGLATVAFGADVNKSTNNVDVEDWKVVDLTTGTAYEFKEDAELTKTVYSNITKTVDDETTVYYGVTLYGPLADEDMEDAAAGFDGGYLMVVAKDAANVQIEDGKKITYARYIEESEVPTDMDDAAYTKIVVDSFIDEADDTDKCGAALKDYAVVDGDFYAAEGTTLAYYKGEFVLIGENEIPAYLAFQPHEFFDDYGTRETCKWNMKDNEIVSVKCTCGDTFKVVQDIKGLASGTYYPLGADDYVILKATTTPDAPAAGTAGDKVNSAETFDAGIAMYVGMSVMAAAGSAVVLKKKD